MTTTGPTPQPLAAEPTAAKPRAGSTPTPGATTGVPLRPGATAGDHMRSGAATGTTVRPPAMRRRVLVELRKTVDTISGSVLTAVTIAAAPLLVVVWLLSVGTEGMTIDVVVGSGSLAAALLVPVLSALVVTSEWGQGAVVTTFALDHARLKVLAAKVVAALVVTLVVALACIAASLLVATAMGIDLGGADGVARTCVGVTAALLLYSLLGSAWGALVLHTPLALGAVLVGPQVVNTLVTLMGERLADAGPWFQVSHVIGDLTQGEVASWPKLAVNAAIWIVVPLALGARRIARAEIS